MQQHAGFMHQPVQPGPSLDAPCTYYRQTIGKPPPSPTKELQSVDAVINANWKYLNLAGIGRLAIALARDSVFGPDVMKNNNTQQLEEEMKYIHDTLRNLFQNVYDITFGASYWHNARESIRMACGRAAKSYNRRKENFIIITFTVYTCISTLDSQHNYISI